MKILKVKDKEFLMYVNSKNLLILKLVFEFRERF